MTTWMKKIPNMITLLRVALSCWVNFYILNHFGNFLIPIIIVSVILLTDFLDGKIARFYGSTSHFGEVFDVLADLFYIVASFTVLCVYRILPLWFLFIILFKFIEFVITSLLLKKLNNRKSIFIFDFIGRFVAVLFYIIPISAYAAFNLSQTLYFFIVHILISTIPFLALISSSYRIGKCIKVLGISMKKKLNYKYNVYLRGAR